MYQPKKANKTSIKLNASYIGETIEAKIRRIVNNKEPITDGAPIIYTDRKDGVSPAHDIRTDRFEIAVEAMDKVTKTHQATREQKMGERTYDTMTTDQQKEFNAKYPNNKFAQQKPNEGKA